MNGWNQSVVTTLKWLENVYRRAAKTIPFSIGLRFLAVYCLVPLFSALLRYSYRLAGFGYLRTDNIKLILTNPLVIGYGVFIAFIYTLIILFEIRGLVRLSSADLEEDRSLKQVYLETGFALARELKNRKIGIFLAALVFVPIFSQTVGSALTPQFNLPVFIRDTILQTPLYRNLFYTLNILLTLLSFGGLFTIHIYWLEGGRLADAFKKSFLLTSRNVGRILLRFLILNAVFFALVAIIYLLGLIVIGLIVYTQIGRGNAFMIALSLSKSVKNIGTWLTAACLAGFNVSLISLMYQEFRGGGSSSPHSRALSETRLKAPERETAPATVISAARSVPAKSGTDRLRPSGHRRFRHLMLSLAVISVVVGIEAVIVNLKLNTDILLMENEGAITVTAHRAGGGPGKAPENSVAALTESVERGADYAEIDVRLTKDGEVVVYHDSNLKRLHQLESKVSELTLQEIQALPFAEKYAEGYPDARIPSLEEMLRAGKDKLRFNIEIKASPEQSPELVQKTVDIVRALEMEDKVFIASLHLRDLKQVKASAPSFKTCYVLPFVSGTFEDVEDVDFYSIEITNLSVDLVHRLHRKGYPVYAWTVNDAERMSQAVDYGVDNIVTDEVSLAKDVILRSDPLDRLEVRLYDWLFPLIEMLQSRK